MQHTLKAKKSGFTMIESLVALGIVAIVSLSGLATMSYIRKVKNRSKEVCMAHVSSTVEKFRSVGYFSAISNFTPMQTANTFTPATDVSLSNRGISDNYMYPSTTNILGAGPAPTINNNILITSSLNALLAIYRSNSAFCTDPNGIAYTNSSPAPASQGFGFPSPDLQGSSMTLQIVPFDTTTGALDNSCPAALRIAPPGVFLDSQTGSAFQGTPPKSTRSPDTKINVGLKLKVTQNYTDEDGAAQSCTIEQRFQYSADTTPPPQPNYKRMFKEAGPDQSPGCSGAANINRYRVEIGYDAAPAPPIEPGSIMVCRDLSFVPSTPKAGYVWAQCRGSNRPANYIPSTLAAPFAVGSTAMDYSGYPAIESSASRPWVPCDQVTVCGVTPTASSIGTPDRPRYRLIYTNLPTLCRAYLQIAAIDTASNSSPTVISASTAVDTVAELNDNKLEWDVPTTLCGSKCGPSYWTPFVYYRCGGCL